jgi:hypothetical protein
MMRCKALFFFFFFPAFLSGQNLVPNNSFEETDCEADFGLPQYFGASGWFNANSATPDYFGSETNTDCWIYSTTTPALIAAGEWIIPRTGNKIAGLWAGDGISCTRDIIGIKLTESLEAGMTYCVSFYVQLSNVSDLAIDKMGVHFSQDSIVNYSSPCWLDVSESIGNTAGEFLTDTSNWVGISGEYIAAGDEQFMLIGNLMNIEETKFLPFEGTKNWSWAYYYVDDVLVLLCDTAVNIESLKPRQIQVYPNPTNTYITVVHNSDVSLCIYNYRGQLMMCSEQVCSYTQIDVSSWPAGSYYIHGIFDSKSYVKQFIVY